VAVLEGEPHAEVALGGAAHGVAGHHPQQLASGRLVWRRHLIVGPIGAGRAKLLGQAADDLPGVGERGADATDERGIVDVAPTSLLEQIR
jgi:hypothetical protein